MSPLLTYLGRCGGGRCAADTPCLPTWGGGCCTADRLAAFERGAAIDPGPCSDPHPPGPRLVIGGALRLCPYCTTPHRGHRRRDTADECRQQILRDWKTRYGYLCPGTPWCDAPGQPHAVAPGDLITDHRTAQAAGGELSDEPAVICRAADSRRT